MNGGNHAMQPPGPPPPDAATQALQAAEGQSLSRIVAGAVIAGAGALVSFVQDDATPFAVTLLGALAVALRPVVEASVPPLLGLIECLSRADRRGERRRLRRRLESAHDSKGGEPGRALVPIVGDPPGPAVPAAGAGGRGVLLPGAVGAAARAAENAQHPPVLLTRWLRRGAETLRYQGGLDEQLCDQLERVPRRAGTGDLHPMLDAHRAMQHWRRSERTQADERFNAALGQRLGRRLEAEIRTNYGLFLLVPALRRAAGPGPVQLEAAEEADAQRAMQELERALLLWPRGDLLSWATTALALGATYRILGAEQSARSMLTRARDTFDTLGVSKGVAAADHNLGWLPPEKAAPPDDLRPARR